MLNKQQDVSLEAVCVHVQGAFPSMEDMVVAERALHEMRSLIRLKQEDASQAQEKRKKDVEEEEERKKQAELQAQQEEQKKSAAVTAKEKARKRGEERERVSFGYRRLVCERF